MFGTCDQICGILSAPALETCAHSICDTQILWVKDQGAALAKIMYCKDAKSPPYRLMKQAAFSLSIYFWPRHIAHMGLLGQAPRQQHKREASNCIEAEQCM